MVKWKKMNKKMAGLLLGVMMLFTALLSSKLNAASSVTLKQVFYSA